MDLTSRRVIRDDPIVPPLQLSTSEPPLSSTVEPPTYDNVFDESGLQGLLLAWSRNTAHVLIHKKLYYYIEEPVLTGLYIFTVIVSGL